MNENDHERPSESQPEPTINEEEFQKFSAPTSHHTEILLDPALNPISERAQSSGKTPHASSGSNANPQRANENNESNKS